MGGGQFQALSIALTGCQVTPLEAESALSFSFSKETTQRDVEAAVESICRIYRELKRLSRIFFQEGVV
jgi:cysteine sulfinate desulfinase/cysteine desulfurase-like protein